MAWTVRLSEQAIRELKRLDPINREMVLAYLEQRIEGCDNPRCCGKPFRDDREGLWRYRIGQYRLICELDYPLVTVYVQGGAMKQMVNTMRDWVCSLGVSLALALLINIFVIQHITVEGHSMDPTLQNQEHLVMSKAPHTLKQLPEYGDIVMIDSRVLRKRSWQDGVAESLGRLFGEQQYIFIKRVIGKPGDVLEFCEGQVFRNGVRLEEPYLAEPMRDRGPQKITVPERSIFVMGDNRNHSLDSRFIGVIPQEHVLGVLCARLNTLLNVAGTGK